MDFITPTLITLGSITGGLLLILTGIVGVRFAVEWMFGMTSLQKRCHDNERACGDLLNEVESLREENLQLQTRLSDLLERLGGLARGEQD